VMEIMKSMESIGLVAFNAFEMDEVAQMLAMTNVYCVLMRLSQVSKGIREVAHGAIREHLVRCEAHFGIETIGCRWRDDLGNVWRSCGRSASLTSSGYSTWGSRHQGTTWSIRVFDAHGSVGPAHLPCDTLRGVWGFSHDEYDKYGESLPSEIHRNGQRMWFEFSDGRPSRRERDLQGHQLPAIIEADGTREWIIDGVKRREDEDGKPRPVIIWADGRVKY
jgi:hypothetical protein